MKQKLTDQTMAFRAVKEFPYGAVVNLGMGIPSLCALFAMEREAILHTENGALGFGPPFSDEEKDQWDYQLVNASAQFVRWLPGMSLFDHATSFGIIRGGHIDITVLGGLQVSEQGDLANWRSPGKTGGMGGAMDLAIGAKKVIVVMEHTAKDGGLKIVKKCSYPLTAEKCVDLIITDIAVIAVTEKGLVLKEYAPEWSVEEIQSLTEPKLTIAEDLKVIDL